MMNRKKIFVSLFAAALVTVPATAQAFAAMQTDNDLREQLPASVQTALYAEQPITELAEPTEAVETNLWLESDWTRGAQQGYVISKGIYTLPATETEAEQELAVVDYQWAASQATASSCTHPNKKKVGTPDLHRSHGYKHPGYCTVYLYQDWRCDDCKQSGTTCTTTLVWYTSPDIIDDVEQPAETV